MWVRENGPFILMSLTLACFVWAMERDAFCGSVERTPPSPIQNLRLMNLNETRPTDLAWTPSDCSSHLTLTWKTPIDFGTKAKAKSRWSYETTKKTEPGIRFETKPHSQGGLDP